MEVRINNREKDVYWITIPNFRPHYCRCDQNVFKEDDLYPIIKYSKTYKRLIQGCRRYQYGNPNSNHCSYFYFLTKGIVRLSSIYI